MGNQSGKVSVKSTKYIGDVDPKNSRTSWIAGKSNKGLKNFLTREKKVILASNPKSFIKMLYLMHVHEFNYRNKLKFKNKE